MKLCTQCQTGYHDSHVTCPTHGAPLHEIRELKPGMVVRQTYRIVRKLGQGGMGTVYLAEHTIMREPRALKFLSAELCRDERFTERFHREASTLRKIRHKNVVDSGDLEPAEDDSLFFAMEFVQGSDLRRFLEHGPVDVALGLTIIRGIAEGLEAAHALGVVHRDLKPENILMGSEGNQWVPKIADFGIVATHEASRVRTKTGGTLLSMPYAAPEQWMGMRSAEMDGRTDLYALGGIFFEMLTGRTPFEADGYEGWAEQHKHTAPPVPSSLRPELKDWRGLDGLVLRLLAKERDARPGNVGEVLTLLDAVQYAEPIQTEGEKPKRTGTRPEAPKQEEKMAATKPTPVAIDARGKWRSRRWVITAAALLTIGVLAWPTWSYFSRRHLPNTPQENTSAQPSESSAVTPSFVTSKFPRTLNGLSEPVQAVAFSPNGKRLASGGFDNNISLWDLNSGQLLHTLTGHSRWVNSVAFSPDGGTLASAGDDAIKLWDASSGELLRTLSGHTNTAVSVAFSPDGHILASGSADTTIKLWDPSSGELLRTLSGHSEMIMSVAFSPDGRTLASSGMDKTIKLWDVKSGQLLHTLNGHSYWVTSVAFNPDGRTLASGSNDKTIKLWDVKSGQLLRTLSGHSDWVESVAFSPDGRTLASASRDKTVKLWDASSGEVLRTLSGHTDYVISVAFSPDGRMLASGCDDKTIKLWDVSDLAH